PRHSLVRTPGLRELRDSARTSFNAEQAGCRLEERTQAELRESLPHNLLIPLAGSPAARRPEVATATAVRPPPVIARPSLGTARYPRIRRPKRRPPGSRSCRDHATSARARCRRLRSLSR